MSASVQDASWSEYSEKVGLAKVLTAGANACFAAKSTRPEAFLSSFYKRNVAVDVIAKAEASEVLDGCGGYTLMLELTLASGTTLTSSVATTHLLGVHPSTARKLLFSTAPRSGTPNPPPSAPSPPAKGGPAPPSAGGGASQAKPIYVQRYEAVARFFNTSVAPALVGISVVDQETFDECIFASDGTSTLSNVLAQTAASLSIASARLSASVLATPLYKVIGGIDGVKRPSVSVPPTLKASSYFLPRPVITMFSTEARHMGRVRVREMCLIPNITNASTSTAAQLVQQNTEKPLFSSFSPKLVQQINQVYETLSQKFDDPPTNVDGSLKYNGYESLPQAIDMLEEAIKDSNSGLLVGHDVHIGVVVDGALCFRPETNKYVFLEGTDYSGAQLAEFLSTTCKDKKVAYLEDPLHENDTQELRRVMHRIGGTVTIAGSHMFAGDIATIQKGAAEMIANNIVLRVSDHGTLSRAIRQTNSFLSAYVGSTLTVACEANETQGAAIADLAVGLGARFVRCGGLLRSEHAAIVNRLLTIQRDLEVSNTLVPPPLWEEITLHLPPAPLEVVAEVNAKDAKKKK